MINRFVRTGTIKYKDLKHGRLEHRKEKTKEDVVSGTKKDEEKRGCQNRALKRAMRYGEGKPTVTDSCLTAEAENF